MRALVYTRPGAMQLQERPLPEAAPGEVLLKIEAVGICGSDSTPGTATTRAERRDWCLDTSSWVASSALRHPASRPVRATPATR